MCVSVDGYVHTRVWVPTKDRKGHQIPWSWHYRVRWVIRCGCRELNIRSLGGTSALNSLTIFVVPHLIFTFEFEKSIKFPELKWHIRSLLTQKEESERSSDYDPRAHVPMSLNGIMWDYVLPEVCWVTRRSLFCFPDFIISLKSISASPTWSTIFQLWILDSQDLKLQAYDYEVVVLNIYHNLPANHTAADTQDSSRRKEGSLPPHSTNSMGKH